MWPWLAYSLCRLQSKAHWYWANWLLETWWIFQGILVLGLRKQRRTKYLTPCTLGCFNLSIYCILFLLSHSLSVALLNTLLLFLSHHSANRIYQLAFISHSNAFKTAFTCNTIFVRQHNQKPKYADFYECAYVFYFTQKKYFSFLAYKLSLHCGNK